MLIDYAFMNFATVDERQLFLEQLYRLKYQGFTPGIGGNFNERRLRYRDPKDKKPLLFDFTVWQAAPIKKSGTVYPLEIVNHRGKMEEILELGKDTAEIIKGFQLSSVPGFSEIDLVAWIGESPSVRSRGYQNELVTSIMMDEGGEIHYILNCETLDEDCCSAACSGHWRADTAREDNAGLWPSLNEQAVRHVPSLMEIKRDDSGKIIAFNIQT